MRNEASSKRGSDGAVKARPMNAAEVVRVTNTRAETIRCYARVGLLQRFVKRPIACVSRK